MENKKTGIPQTAKTAPPFARDLVRLRARRAARRNQRTGDIPFLYPRIAKDVAERLLDVNRTFETCLLIGPAALSRLVIEAAGQKLTHVTIAEFTDHKEAGVQYCDEEALSFKYGHYDVVISLLSLHKVNAVPDALAGFRNLLKPDGLFLGAFFGGETLGGLRRALYETEEMVSGQISPRVSPMIDVHSAAQLMQGSGLKMPVIDRDKVSVNYKALTGLFDDLRAMGDTNVLTLRDKNPLPRHFFAALEGVYRAQSGSESGRLPAIFDIIWLTGWAAHPDQQKPLKPGSAKTRLADALGVKEKKL